MFCIMDDDVIKRPIDCRNCQVAACVEISKELEDINFQSMHLKNAELKEKINDIITVTTKARVKRWSLKNNKVTPETNKSRKTNEPKTQLAAFGGAMKLLIILGALIGLNPVRGILRTDVQNIRFTKCYWRFIHSVLIGTSQAAASAMCLYSLIVNTLTVSGLGDFSFWLSTCVTTFLFVRIGNKWPKLMMDISKCNLSEYINPRIKVNCYVTCVVFFTFAIIEHLLSINVRIVNMVECHANETMYKLYLQHQFPWLFQLNKNLFAPVGELVQILSVCSTLTWSYSDAYIICASMYLTSLLEQINKKIVLASQKHYLPSSYWRSLREDYNRATQLVRSFDDVLSGIVFTCFASNLFFICLQLFNILMHGVKFKETSDCPDLGKGPFRGYEYPVYLLFSMTFLLMKSLAVSVIAASVNTASLVPAHALYSVPSTAYCDEVSRFITQVNGDNPALSGLQFFYVTRDLILSCLYGAGFKDTRKAIFEMKFSASAQLRLRAALGSLRPHPAPRCRRHRYRAEPRGPRAAVPVGSSQTQLCTRPDDEHLICSKPGSTYSIPNMAGTIVTYELVLLQFSSDGIAT